MYQTIEADIENGRIISSELYKLPAVAHVLIVWVQSPEENVSSDDFDLAGKRKRTEDA